MPSNTGVLVLVLIACTGQTTVGGNFVVGKTEEENHLKNAHFDTRWAEANWGIERSWGTTGNPKRAGAVLWDGEVDAARRALGPGN